MRSLIVAAALALLTGCGHGGGGGGGQPSATAATDGDGVELLFPSASGGSSLRLGREDPNTATGFRVEQGGSSPVVATAHAEAGVAFWNLLCYPLDYASGGTGTTARLHLYASGGTQRYTWRTQPGYLSSPRDVRDQEFTAYVRAHTISDPARAQITLKIRGGAHSASDGDLASCTMLTLGPAGSRAARFGKELSHPDYDYVALTPRFAYALTDDAWVGMKVVSWRMPGTPKRVINQLWLDTDPFDPSGHPRNGWRQFSEYVDVDGVSTGAYSAVADWGGWQTTLRVDGLHDVDIAIIGVREIGPPAAQ